MPQVRVTYTLKEFDPCFTDKLTVKDTAHGTIKQALKRHVAGLKPEAHVLRILLVEPAGGASKPIRKRGVSMATKRKKKAAAGKESKMDQARKIYKSVRNAHEKRGDVVEKFIDRLGMSKAMAGTYFQNIRNEANAK